jgi:hypothetical protein
VRLPRVLGGSPISRAIMILMDGFVDPSKLYPGREQQGERLTRLCKIAMAGNGMTVFSLGSVLACYAKLPYCPHLDNCLRAAKGRRSNQAAGAWRGPIGIKPGRIYPRSPPDQPSDSPTTKDCSALQSLVPVISRMVASQGGMDSVIVVPLTCGVSASAVTPLESGTSCYAACD